MYLYTSYSGDAFYVGGGNADKLNWVSQVYTTGYKPSKSDVGLGNVDNTADANKSVNYATTAGNANKVNNLTVQTAVPANAVFTDTKVTQTVVSDSEDNDYPILLAGSANIATETAGVKKASNVTVNPVSETLDITGNNGSQTSLYSDFLQVRGATGSGHVVYLSGADGTIYTNGKIFCGSMDVTDISSQYTFSKTSGNWSIQSFEVFRMGNFIQMRITFKGNGSNVASGSNGFVGAITGGAIPVCESKLMGYYGGMTCITNISNEGAITARVCGGTSTTIPASGAMGVAGYFLTNN